MRVPLKRTRFGLRSLFALIMLIAAILSWYGGRYQRACRHWEAECALRDAGENVDRLTASTPSILDRLLFRDPLSVPLHVIISQRGMLGRVTDLGNVRTLNIRTDSGVTDVDMPRLSGLAELRELYVGPDRVGDAALEHIRGLDSLEHLWFRGRNVTSKGVMSLGSLPLITDLGLSDTQIDDSGVAYVCRWRTLESVALCGTKITDRCMGEWRRVPRLRELFLANNKLSDAGVACLAHVPMLERLDVSSTQITDDGLSYITKLQHLRDLRLRGNRITDVGLAHLDSMESLWNLDLSDTDVTEAGVMRLVKSKSDGMIKLVNTRIGPDAVKRFHRENGAVRVFMYEPTTH